MDAEIIRTRRPHVRESEFQTPDNLYSALTIRFPVFDEHGELSHIGGVILDTSAQREAEAELQRSREALMQSEKMNALGSLLAGVSHELNNPLAIVVGEAVLLQEEAEGTEYAESATRIQRAAERCSRIVQTFLAMARQKAPERRSKDLAKLVKATLELADYGLRSNGVEVAFTAAEDLPPVFVDPDQVTQILLNLIVNAQQALQNQLLPSGSPCESRRPVQTRLR
ncbi:hypothetical protein HMF7854_12050 [Sphingomonas ginkgonis]|uniref:histidine kinase n=1 Tax=Sphingomonas ginkgonis TaxID=2315330 RepID=A0A3R9WR95_9SPHN|nr:histidine kinase dimerization/phospho-acceptor domain-containing protein [Sphingomonas ginkgonis]RST31491.1 hypothetical protein HMF7854_12050 [Sphingomonas ginkgonis]